MSDTTLSPILLAGEALTIEAALSGEKIPRFSITPAYNGGPLRVARYNLPIIVDLAGLTVNSQAVLATVGHNDEQQVGHVEKIDNNGRQLSVAGVISAAGPAATELIESHRRGFPWHASIEARPLETPEYIGPGEAVRVNGQLFAGPVLVARRSELFGISFVPRGADEHTAVAIAAQAVGDGAPITFEEWIDAIGVTADDLAANPDLEQRLRAKYDEATGNKSDDTDTSDSDSDEEEDMNASQLQAAVDATIQAADITPSAAALLRAEVISGKMTFNDFERAVIKCAQAKADLAALRASRPKGPTIMAGHHASDKSAVQAALFRHLGLEAIGEKTLGAHAMEAGAALRCTHFLDVVKASLTAAGRDIPASRDDMIKAALSTADLAGMLGNTANKLLLDAYQAVPSVARLIARPLSANNFKQHTGYRLTGDSAFKLLPPSGEIKHGTLGEASYPYKVDTYARMFGITRNDIINDDLGAMQSVPQTLGRGAAVALEAAFWTLVLANTGNFFGVGHLNYISGGTSPLDITSLGAAVTKMRQAVDADGVPVLVVPKYLVVPPELETTADALYTSTNIVATGATDLVTPAGNPHANKYQPLVVPHLSNSTYSGYSTTGWYLFGDPSDVAAFGVAYLNGVESPTVESGDAPFNTLGMQFRGYLDFGVCQIDYRGGVMSAGT